MGKEYSEYEKLAMKSLMRIWQNNEVFLKAEVCGDVIAIYYHCDHESFDVEKEQFFYLNFWRCLNSIKRIGLLILQSAFINSDLTIVT